MREPERTDTNSPTMDGKIGTIAFFKAWWSVACPLVKPLVLANNIKSLVKTSVISAIITGIFTALTTKFPGGQVPNIIDKIISANIVYLIIILINKVKFISSLTEKKKNALIAAVVFPIGTLISGTIFLLSAQLIVGLPAPFIALFLTVVLPATIINLVAGIFLYKVVEISMKRIAYSR